MNTDRQEPQASAPCKCNPDNTRRMGHNLICGGCGRTIYINCFPRQLELPFTAKARREIARAESPAKHSFKVNESGDINGMIVEAHDAGHAKRIASQQWPQRFGRKANYLELKAKRLDPTI